MADDCPICLQSLEENLFKCPHCSNDFHKPCIIQWTNSLSTWKIKSCPLCRSEINPREQSILGQVLNMVFTQPPEPINPREEEEVPVPPPAILPDQPEPINPREVPRPETRPFVRHTITENFTPSVPQSSGSIVPLENVRSRFGYTTIDFTLTRPTDLSVEERLERILQEREDDGDGSIRQRLARSAIRDGQGALARNSFENENVDEEVPLHNGPEPMQQPPWAAERAEALRARTNRIVREAGLPARLLRMAGLIS